VQQIHVFFSGTVQGVGFRYTVRRMAQELGLNGWVRNLGDGRVEMLAQGNQAQLEILMQKINDHFDGYIREKNIENIQTDDMLDPFRIII